MSECNQTLPLRPVFHSSISVRVRSVERLDWLRWIFRHLPPYCGEQHGQSMYGCLFHFALAILSALELWYSIVLHLSTIPCNWPHSYNIWVLYYAALDSPLSRRINSDKRASSSLRLTLQMLER